MEELSQDILDLYFKRGGIQSSRELNQILLSVTVRKENRVLGLMQRRILVISNETLDVFKRNGPTLVLKRRVILKDLRAVTGTQADASILVIHIANGHDLVVYSDM